MFITFYNPFPSDMNGTRIDKTLRSWFLPVHQELRVRFSASNYAKAKKQALKKNHLKFIEFITTAAMSSAFRDDLYWPIENFKAKTESEKIRLFPGFYLFVERYIFNAVETSQQSFREALYHQFGDTIERNSALKIIFLSTERQICALYRRFLFSVASKSLKAAGKNTALVHALQHVLNGHRSEFYGDHFDGLEERVKWVRLSQSFYQAFAKEIDEKLILQIYNEAYQNLFVRYQNLTTFPEMLKLFPGRALDDTKYNLLSNQQMKSLLAEKVESLELISAELRVKNRQLENQYDELAAQSDQLNLQNERLMEAHELIELMNEELNSYSRRLEEKVHERTKELAQSNRLLKLYNENLEQYTFAISHQLKAPVARLVGLTNLMRILPEAERAVVCDNLQQSAKELESVFKDLVHSLNLKNDAANVQIQRFDICTTVLECWQSVMKSGLQPLPQMELTISGDSFIESDAHHVKEALTHVLDNAAKFSMSKIESPISVLVSHTECDVCITIADSGIGFDLEAVREKLFSPFSRFNMTHPGRGLGLYFTRQHIAILGGDVKLESSPERGTTVLIQVPLQ